MCRAAGSADSNLSLLVGPLTVRMVVCRAADPAAVNVCLLVAFGDTATVAATLYLQPQVVQLLQGYLFWVAENFVAPQFAGILGTPLGPNSGGMLASRSIYQWLYGEHAVKQPRQSLAPTGHLVIKIAGNQGC